MYSILHKKYKELMTCEDEDLILKSLEYLKTNSYHCYKIIKEYPDFKYRDDLIKHCIDVFNCNSQWRDLRFLISKDQKQLLLNKLKYFPNYCCDLIKVGAYDDLYELNQLVEGLVKNITNVIDIFQFQVKTFLPLEVNMKLYNAIKESDIDALFVDAFHKAKHIDEIRSLMFNEIICNDDKLKKLIYNIDILIDLKKEEKAKIYEICRNDIFKKYKNTKKKYLDYCVYFNEHIGVEERKLYIDKVLKNCKGFEVKRYLNWITIQDEAKEYLDSCLILNKLI